MKSALIRVLFLLFAIGVFGDADKAETVSVIEGDSVTLHTGVTGIQRDDMIDWRLNGNLIARIRDGNITTNGAHRDGMQLNKQTGDLKITKIKTTDSGLYKVEIIPRTGGSSVKIFSVSDILSRLSVKEGVTVILESGVTKLYGDDLVQWRFQHRDVLAEINKTAGVFSTYDDVSDGRFKGRLKLNKQTGSLIITNTKTSDFGLYHLNITGNKHTIFGKFILSVCDDVTWISAVAVVLGVLLVIVTAVACGIYYRYRRYKLVTHSDSESSVEKFLEKPPV